MNHTKGPWHAEDGFVFSNRTGQRIADCYCDEQPDMSNARIEANARLIAIAPELLEALETSVALIETMLRTFSDNGGGAFCVPEQARAVIAKARGQRDECSHGVRRDLCPDCSPENAVLDYSAEFPQGEPRIVLEPTVHSHNAACYMLGQRTVSYRTCGKLEGEPQ